MPRDVRVTDTFFDRLDDLLPSERSVRGDPSSSDFLRHEMPRVIERLASSFEQVTMPVVPGSDVRVLITAGVFGRNLAFYVAIAPDGWVEILDLDMD